MAQQKAAAFQQAEGDTRAGLVYATGAAVFSGLGRGLGGGLDGVADVALQVGGGDAAGARASGGAGADEVASGGVDGAQRLDGQLVAADVAAQGGDVASGGEERAARGAAVASGAAGLLSVGFERAGKLVVDDEAHIGLVYAHAEGDGGDDDASTSGDEVVLGGVALGALHAGVVVQRAHAAAPAQELGYLLAAVARADVDDAAAGSVFDDLGQGAQAVLTVGDVDDLVGEIGAEDAAIDDAQWAAERV